MADEWRKYAIAYWSIIRPNQDLLMSSHYNTSVLLYIQLDENVI